MGERRKKALEKWARGVEGLIDTPPTVENHGPKKTHQKVCYGM